jgi:hypothetical protein
MTTSSYELRFVGKILRAKIRSNRRIYALVAVVVVVFLTVFFGDAFFGDVFLGDLIFFGDFGLVACRDRGYVSSKLC